MPSHTEDPYTDPCKLFCLALKAERERKGITLDAIAAVTKIPASVFASLERSDLRHWPKGLFRRSFFRDYVRVIGMPPEETCEEFVRLFPDDTTATLAAPVAAPEPSQADELRMKLDSVWQIIARAGHRGAEAMSRVFDTPRLRVRIKVPR